MAPTKICKEVQEWIDIVEQDKIRCCEEQHLLVAHIKKCFETENIYTDTEQLGNYIRIIEKYLPFKLFTWEKFVIALHDCTYWTDTRQPRWPDLFCMTGRGAGKDGMIAAESLCLSSQYNGIREYDVDICANNEEQALRPVQDLKMAFEEPKITKQIKRFYHWTKERIVALRTRSIIRGRTNSPKGKDGLRSGIVIFNEIHQYQNYDNINVFTTGLGKKMHPRRSYYTTNGDVREGPLDDILEDGEDSLRAGSDDNGMLYFICKLNKKEDVHDEANWTMANPSLPYLPHLQQETRKEYREWVKSPERLSAFISKRMNLTEQTKEGAVTSWDCIAATNKPIPDLTGRSCTVGIDYAKTTDWVAVNVHFKDGDKRYDINKAWICGESKDIPRIKAPWREWAKTPTMLEYVDDVEIHPETVAAYVKTVAQRYKVEQVAIDSYRYTLMADALSKIGFSPQRKNLILVKQTDILKVVPVIDHCFIHGYFHWGDNPVLRWATNNTKLIRYGRNVGADKGSFVYAKIEAKSRKTDPWMALVASMVCESEIKEKPTLVRAPVITL